MRPLRLRTPPGSLVVAHTDDGPRAAQLLAVERQGGRWVARLPLGCWPVERVSSVLLRGLLRGSEQTRAAELLRAQGLRLARPRAGLPVVRGVSVAGGVVDVLPWGPGTLAIVEYAA